MMDLQQLLTQALDNNASDVHLVVGLPPLFRIHTVLEPVAGQGPVTKEDTEACVKNMVGQKRFDTLLRWCRSASQEPLGVASPVFRGPHHRTTASPTRSCQGLR